MTWFPREKVSSCATLGDVRRLTSRPDGACTFASTNRRARTFARHKSFTSNVTATTGDESFGELERMFGDVDLTARNDLGLTVRNDAWDEKDLLTSMEWYRRCLGVASLLNQSMRE